MSRLRLRCSSIPDTPALLSLLLRLSVVLRYFGTGLVQRSPTAILASSVAIIAVLSLVVGTLLEATRRARDEGARLAYLRLPPPGHG